MSFPLVADPRVQLQEINDVVAPEHHLLADGLPPNFETYLFYAREQRDREAAQARQEGHRPPTGWLSEVFGLNPLRDQSLDEKRAVPDENAILTVTPAELRAASGSLRTASWGAIFYLITTGRRVSNDRCLSDQRDRYPWSLRGTLCICAGGIWSGCCMFRRTWCYGCLQRSFALASIPEIGFRSVPPQILWRPWVPYLWELVPHLYVCHFIL